MRPRLALLSGVLALAVPAALLGVALRPAPEPPRAWAKTPADPLRPAPDPPAHWDSPARESLTFLRRVTATEAKRSVAALAACEAHAGHLTAMRRKGDYRRCATA